MSKIRLQVALSRCGTASRRKSATIIESGHVKVNGKVIKERGFSVDVHKDRITVYKNPLLFKEKKEYYILNKPPGVLSTTKDERGRKTVLDYIEKKNTRLYTIGRLDKDTKGLIILTNDGDLTYRLTHPKFNIKRVYEVKAKGIVEEKSITRLKNGVNIEGKLARAVKVNFLKKGKSFTVLSLTLTEGRKREVRKMLSAIGHDVLELKRISFGSLRLKDLKEGKIRALKKVEVEKLKNSVGL